MCTACTVTTTKASDLFETVSLEYEAALVHLAVDLLVAVDPANTLDLAAHLEGDRRALDLQVLDQHHGIAVRQKLTVGVADDSLGVVVLGAGFCNRSFVAAVSANIVVAIRVGVGQGALGTGRVDVGHGVWCATGRRRRALYCLANNWPDWCVCRAVFEVKSLS
ncbi:MAG: hypothetical protein ACI9I0_001902 [Rhodoferax sp.]|jgi:hypothetical protein